MEDVLTEIAPPSRFFQDDLNNFTPPSPPLPTPFLLFSDNKLDQPLFPSLLIVALSSPSLHVFHNLSTKDLFGSLILPEIPLSGNSVEPTLGDKSCNIYALDGTDHPIFLVNVQCAVSAERSNMVAKLLIGDRIVPKRVLIFDSIQSQNFRGKLSPDETYVFKLETSAEKRALENTSDTATPLLNDIDYFPSGSVVDGLAAALLARCQLMEIRGALCVSWPECGASVISVIRSLLHKNVLHDFDFHLNGDNEDKLLSHIKDYPFDSELYT